MHGSGPIGYATGGASKLYVKDLHTDVVAEAPASGTAAQLNAATWYSPWGERTSLESTLGLLGFQGQPQTKLATGSGPELVDMTTRYYVAGLGRFTTGDVLMGDASDPMSLNRWGYGLGSPVSNSDPSGMRSCGQLCDPGGDLPTPSEDPDDTPTMTPTPESPSSDPDGSGPQQPSPQPAPVYTVREFKHMQRVCAVMDCPSGLEGLGTFVLDLGQGALAVCGFVPAVGDIACDLPDAAISAARGDHLGAAIDIAGVIPFLGWPADSTDTGRSGFRFWNTALDVFDVGRGASRTLPDALRIGRNAEQGVDVYIGIKNGEEVYAGISNNWVRRAAQHGIRFDDVARLTSSPVTRGEARAIEEALILRNQGQNIRHSISPSHAYYSDAVAWGESWLRNSGF